MADSDVHGSGTPPGVASPGPGVDRYGVPVYDPSNNVYALVRAAIERQDDLRVLATQHLRELTQLDREHAKEMRQAESERINAILAENAGNVQRAAEVQLAQQQALAAQVAASAETVRTQMTATAATVAETLRTTVAPMQARIEELSRAQYETQGQKQQVVETTSGSRDDIAIEQARLQAAQTRMQFYGLLIAALVLAVGLYGALHH
jgi:hypothetical protein